MSRRVEIWLIPGFVLAFAAAVILGQRSGWNREQLDFRMSTLLDGPNGASGLAQVLERTGVQIERQRRSYFDITAGTIDPNRLVAFLAPAIPPTDQELASIRRYVEQGGSVLLIGDSDVAECLGWVVQESVDPAEIESGSDDIRFPPVLEYVEPLAPGSERLLTDAATDACGPLASSTTDIDLMNTEGQPVALTVRTGGGGTVKVLAAHKYATNRELKETEVGLFLIPWVTRGGFRTIVFDEYHHGFGEQRSLTGAALRWMVGTPGGWALVHLTVAALIGLVVLGVRFGRPLQRIESRRRSELEHLDALAAGLRRSQRDGTVLRLLIGGLRRRLRQPGMATPPTAELERWLDSFDLIPLTPAAREAQRQLKLDIRSSGDASKVLAAANAVEDMWNAMGYTAPLNKS